MSLIFLGVVAALVQASEPPAIAPAPPPPHDRPATPSPQIRPPFETGQLVFTIRVWAGGTTRCDARGIGSRFEAAAAYYCSFGSTLSEEGAADGDPIVEVATVFTVTRAGDAMAPLPAARGRTSFDAEVEVVVSPNGSVIACRLLQGERSNGAAEELRPDTFCSDMLGSSPSFEAWNGEGTRRGRFRVTVFSTGQPAGG